MEIQLAASAAPEDGAAKDAKVSGPPSAEAIRRRAFSALLWTLGCSDVSEGRC